MQSRNLETFSAQQQETGSPLNGMDDPKLRVLKLGCIWIPTTTFAQAPVSQWMNPGLQSTNILAAGPSSSSSAPTCRAEHPQPTQEGLSTWMGPGLLYASTSHVERAAEST